MQVNQSSLSSGMLTLNIVGNQMFSSKQQVLHLITSVCTSFCLKWRVKQELEKLNALAGK